MFLLWFLVASSAFAQVQQLYSYTAGQAFNPAVATTAPIPCCRSAYVVTMSSDTEGDPMELRAWNDTGSSLVRIGTAFWTPGTGSAIAYSMATLDANRVVAAYVDESYTLYVGVWMVGATNPSPFYLQGFGSATTSGSLNGVAITALSSTEVVTAAVDPSGNLRIQTWAIGADGTVSLQNTEIGESVFDVFMTAMSPTQVVTAVDVESDNPGGASAVRVWQIGSEGTITRQGSVTVNGGYTTTSGIALAPLGGLFGNYELMTSYTHVIVNSKGVGTGEELQVMSWNVTTAGVVTSGRSGTAQEGDGENSSSSTAIAWTPALNPLTVSTGGISTGALSSTFSVGAEEWKYNESTSSWSAASSITLAVDTLSYGPGGAVAAEGTSPGFTYYAVAFTDTSGNLRLTVLSCQPL